MGVIQRQGFKGSVVSYIGVGIGALSTLYVYPKTLELLGLFRSMYDAATLVGIVILLGSATSSIRFFPKYKDPETGHKGFLTWLLMVCGAGFLFFLILFPLMQKWIMKYVFHERNDAYEEFIYYLIPLALFIALITLLVKYAYNFKRITIPTAFEQLTIKIALPLIFILYLLGWLTVRGVVISIVATFALATLGIILYLKSLGEWRLTKPQILRDKEGLKEYKNYSLFGIMSGVGSMVAFRIDTIMVTSMIQFQATGVYAIALTLSEIIIKPMRSLSAISAPVLAHHIENGNMAEVKNIYRKSSLNMTIIGVGLFLAIWTVLPYIFSIMPNSDIVRSGTYVVFFLGLAQVWDMMTGVNNELILYSKHYRFTLYLTLLLGVLTITANYFFIKWYGLTGAAMGTCISMFLFNVVKLLFIKIKYGFFPFTDKLIPVFGFGTAAWLLSKWIPAIGEPYIDFVIKGFVFCLLYGLAIWKLKLSPEINEWIALVFGKVVKVKSLFTKS